MSKRQSLSVKSDFLRQGTELSFVPLLFRYTELRSRTRSNGNQAREANRTTVTTAAAFKSKHFEIDARHLFVSCSTLFSPNSLNAFEPPC
jgi:hypothetical protein